MDHITPEHLKALPDIIGIVAYQGPDGPTKIREMYADSFAVSDADMLEALQALHLECLPKLSVT